MDHESRKSCGFTAKCRACSDVDTRFGNCSNSKSQVELQNLEGCCNAKRYS